MFRLFVLLCLSSASLFALDLVRGYTLLAGSIHSDNDVIMAEDDVIIFSTSDTFRADSVRYNPKSADLELLGNVDIMIDGQILNKINHTIYNLKSKKFSGKNLFAYDNNSKMWFYAKDVSGEKTHLKLTKTTISSCNRRDPDWHISFSKGFYNKDQEYISIYNPTFYVGDFPVMYLPWFGFTTNKNRKSGFLKPILGFENSENLFFVLPYYVASAKNWDLEIDPQIRLNRGVGLYSTFRFVDSDHSFGEVNLGIFEEKESYFRRKHLQNRAHKGIGFKYQNRALLTSGDENATFHDGLLIDATYLNDIDYVNLDHKTGLATSKLVTSKSNYVYYGARDFIGLYAKYFIDTEKKSNADTLQTLPSLQYHRFSQDIGMPHFLYSLDYKFKNNYRRIGLNARQHELSVPLTYHQSIWGDFLNFKVSENFYYSRVDYSNADQKRENANYFSNYHDISLFSDLTKQYDTYTHNVQLSLGLILPSFEKKSGYFADFLPFNLETKSLSFKFNQYYYDKQGFNFFMHRLRQTLYDDDTLYKYSDLENQVIYRYSPKFSMHNTLFYSHKYDKIKKLQTGFDYNNDQWSLLFNHTYEYKPQEKNTNFVSSSFQAKVDDTYRIFGSLDYDIEDKFTKEWTLGWHMKKRCWDYKFRYKESVTPSLTSGGTESLIKRGVLLYVRFSPFGGMAYDFNFNEETQQNERAIEGIE